MYASTVPMPCRTREVISAGSSWSSVTGVSALWCVVAKVTGNSPLDFLHLLTSAAWILPPEKQSCAPRRGPHAPLLPGKTPIVEEQLGALGYNFPIHHWQ